MTSNKTHHFKNPIDRWLAEHLESEDDVNDTKGYFEDCSPEELKEVRRHIRLANHAIEERLSELEKAKEVQ